MKVRLMHLWEIVTTSYWFVPSLMMLGACLMATGMLYIDRNYITTDVQIEWLYTGSAEGARTLLSAVAGSVITVAGVVFSITIAALTQAAAQFGPRLLRNFMRDTSNQVVLGTFVATFVYCILILRTVHGAMETGIAFVPQASVTVGVAMALASIAVLIYFIHHVSISLQAPSIVAAVRADLVRVLKQLQQGRQAGSAPTDRNASPLPPDFDEKSCPIPSSGDGYLQVVDYQSLTRAASDAGLLLRLECRAGDYLIKGNPLLRACPAERFNEELCARINKAFICGDHRTPEQDVEHAIRQIVEIAVRALSPGINDPFTAINCIDALGSSICLIERQGLPGPLYHDRQDKLRVVARTSTFAGVIDAAFNQIRQYGRQSTAVTIRLLETVAACARQTSDADQRQVLHDHAEMIYRQGQCPEAIPEERDRNDVRKSWETAMEALGPPHSP